MNLVVYRCRSRSLKPLTILLHKPLQDFQDKNGQASVWTAQQQAVQVLLEMPAELQTFVTKTH